MRGFIYFLCIVFCVLSAACTHTQKSNTQQNQVNASAEDLKKFALAQCLIRYFEAKGYDPTDLKKISGGIVEITDVSIEELEGLVTRIRTADAQNNTKQNINPLLNQCFHLEKFLESTETPGSANHISPQGNPLHGGVIIEQRKLLLHDLQLFLVIGFFNVVLGNING